MTFREQVVIECWLDSLDVDEEKWSEMRSVYERMKDDGHYYQTIANTLTEMRNEQGTRY